MVCCLFQSSLYIGGCHGQVADLAIVMVFFQKEKTHTRQPVFFTISEIVLLQGILVSGIYFFRCPEPPPYFLVYIPGVYDCEKYGSVVAPETKVHTQLFGLMGGN